MVASLDPIEFATRVHALARRARPDTRTGQILRHRDLVMDVAAPEVRIAGRQVALTAQPTVSSGASVAGSLSSPRGACPGQRDGRPPALSARPNRGFAGELTVAGEHRGDRE